MNGYVKLGLLLNCVGAVTAAGLLLSVPSLRTLAVVLVLPVVVQGVGFVWLRRNRQPMGSILFAIGSLLLLPFGVVGLVAAWRSHLEERYGSAIGKVQPEPRQRPRAWTLGTIVFAGAALGAFAWALAWPRVAHLQDLQTAFVSLAAALLAILSGFEAVLLWQRREEAVRLGVALSVVGAATCAVAGFYLHSYIAVALLPVPLYGLLLVLSGRERWQGLASQASEGPGTEGRARRRATI